MNPQHNKCLVLNGDYTPLTIVNWKKALLWSIRHEHKKDAGAEVLDFYKDDYIVGTNNKKFSIPAVVKTRNFFKINKATVNFSRKNIFIRDNSSSYILCKN